MIQHTIRPFFDKQSKILILGSFPSVASRAVGFYYGHKQNRFWSVLARVFNQETPCTVQQKQAFLTENHIALWDVVASCDINGSQDSTIGNVKVNDLSVILDDSSVTRIFVNGRKAMQLYNKHLAREYGEAQYLPSTSAANAAWSMEKLCGEWSKILKNG